MADAKSDLVNVLSSLEAHWHVLEAEVVEINRDIEYCEQCLRKYGEWFNSPLQYLRELKRTKKNKMCNYPHTAPPHTQPEGSNRLRRPWSQEGDHPHDGELQCQPSGWQEAREIAREAVGEPRTRIPRPCTCVAMVLRTPRLPPLPSPPPGASASYCIIAREGMAAAVKAAVHARSHCHPPVAAQPVACLQAPATPAIVAGMEEGAAFNVGSNASSQQRVIMPVHA